MKRILISVAVCSILALGGCKQNTQPNASGTTTKHPGGIPFTAAWANNGCVGTFQVDNTLGHDVNGIETSGLEAMVYLWDTSSSQSISGGTVAINGTSLATMDHTAVGGGVYYMLNSGNGQTVPMAYDGSPLIFSASGSTHFPALKDTIAYVNKQMTLTTPSAPDTLSASSGFTITWPYNSGSIDTVAVQLMGDTSYYVASTADNGNFTVTPTMLSGFSTGSAVDVMVTRITYKYVPASSGSGFYVMACYSREDDGHFLKP